MKLTNEQLDALIKKADAVYDENVGKAGDYKRYHAICAMIYCMDYQLGEDNVDFDYDPEAVDSRCIKLGQDEFDASIY